MFSRILIVCVGNICRSPMAEGLLRAELSRVGKGGIEVASAGLGAVVGAGADPIAVELMRERGIDVTGHVARQLTGELLRPYELVLCMEKWQVRDVERLAPAARGKVFRIGHWGEFDVPDPHGHSREMFVEVLRLIERGVGDVLRVL